MPGSKSIDSTLKKAQQEKDGLSAKADPSAVSEDMRRSASKFAAMTGISGVPSAVSGIPIVVANDFKQLNEALQARDTTIVIDQATLESVKEALLSGKNPQAAAALAKSYMMSYSYELASKIVEASLNEPASGTPNQYMEMRSAVRNLFADKNAAPEEARVNAALGSLLGDICQYALTALLAVHIASGQDGVAGPTSDGKLLEFTRPRDLLQQTTMLAYLFEAALETASINNINIKESETSVHKDAIMDSAVRMGFGASGQALKILAYSTQRIMDEEARTRDITPDTEYGVALLRELKENVIMIEGALLAFSMLGSGRDPAEFLKDPRSLLKGTQPLLRGAV